MFGINGKPCVTFDEYVHAFGERITKWFRSDHCVNDWDDAEKLDRFMQKKYKSFVYRKTNFRLRG